LDLARGWSGTGARVVLADAGLEAPSLHLSLGGTQGEGLVDALRWGASMRRVARSPEGCGFFAITAGTPVADGPSLLEGPGWPALCEGFREAGVTLAVLVPARDACLGPVLKQAAAIVVLAARDEAVPLALRLGKAPIVAVVGRDAPPSGETSADLHPEPASGKEALPRGPQDLTPSGGAPPEGGALEEELPSGALEPEETLGAGAAALVEPELQALVPAEPAPPEPELQPFVPEPAPELETSVPEPEPAPPEPAPERAARAPEPELYGDPIPTFEEIVEESEAAAPPPWWARRGTLAALVVLVLVVAAAIAAALLGYLRIPGLTSGDEPPESLPAQAATVASPPATETSEAAPFSVGLAAFQDEAAASAMVADLSGKVPGVLFTTSPVDVEGQILHRVLAGPAADSAAAMSLGARVAEAAGLGADGWMPRRTPRAFHLGEMPEQEAALRRSQVLQGLGVPSYVLAVTYSDGSVRFRVYAGAYADDAEATYLSGLLQERGLSGATLSDRTGRLPE